MNTKKEHQQHGGSIDDTTTSDTGFETMDELVDLGDMMKSATTASIAVWQGRIIGC
jgi:hypothetical protein